MRYALVSLRNDNAETIERYLPANYRKIGFAPHEPQSPQHTVTSYGPAIVIAGEDSCGWTLDDYVIPRLASGLITAEEIPADDPILKKLDEEDTRPRVKLVQSGRFPNVWTLQSPDEERCYGFWRDTMFANGVISSEAAVLYAREHGLRIVAVESEYMTEGPVDPRTDREVDNASEVIAGIEYRSQEPVLEPLYFQETHRSV